MGATVTKKNQQAAAKQDDSLLGQLDQKQKLDEIVADHKPDAEKVAVIEGKSFGWAVEQARSSNIVIRKSSFNQKHGIKLIQNKRGFAFMQWSVLHNAYAPWMPTIDDILANDWIICKLVNPASLGGSK